MVENNELENVYKFADYIANSAAAIPNPNPFAILTSAIHILCKHNKDDKSTFSKNISLLMSIPLIRHRNVIISFVDRWSEITGKKVKEYDSLNVDDKKVIDTLTNEAYKLKEQIPEGYRTPLTILDELDNREQKSMLSKDGSAALEKVKANDTLAGTFLERVASWQKQ